MSNVNLIGRLTRDPELRQVRGRQAAVSGRLVFGDWSGRDGCKRWAHSVQGKVDFLGARTEADGAASPSIR